MREIDIARVFGPGNLQPGAGQAAIQFALIISVHLPVRPDLGRRMRHIAVVDADSLDDHPLLHTTRGRKGDADHLHALALDRQALDRRGIGLINVEIGARFNVAQSRNEVILFQSGYDNMHGNCAASIGCNPDNIGDQYNFGEVKVTGIELSSQRDFALQNGFKVPLKLSYTYTDSEFRSDFNSGIWGVVSRGDKMPYVPQNQFSLQLGLEGELFALHSRLSYVSAAHASLEAQDLNAIDGRTVVDLSAKYQPGQPQRQPVDHLQCGGVEIQYPALFSCG